MPKNKLQDLRNHLFETLESLKDETNPMPIDRAETICKVSEQIIETAKVEVKFLEVTDALATTEFFGDMTPRIEGARAPFEDLRRPKLANGSAR
jgi:hypothetical protein